MHVPAVSVIIPCYRAMDVLPLQLTALERQADAPPAEIILVDNGENPGLRGLVSQWSERLPGLRLVTSLSPSGAGAARNAGIAAATADLLLFCDADDVVMPEWVASGVRVLERHRAFSGVAVPVSEELCDEGWPAVTEAIGPHKDHADELSHSGSPDYPILMGGSFGMRREIALAVGGFDLSFGSQAEDNDLAFRLQRELGGQLPHASHVCVAYRVRSGGNRRFSRGFNAGRAHALLLARHDAWRASSAYRGLWPLRPVKTLVREISSRRSLASAETLGRDLGLILGWLRYRHGHFLPQPQFLRMAGDRKREALCLTEGVSPPSGREHPRLPYGFEHLKALGWNLQFPTRKASGFSRKLRDVIEHRSGVLVEAGLRGLLSRPDDVFCVLENHAELPLRLRGLRIPPYATSRLVVMICWETERMRHMSAVEVEKRTELFNRADQLFVFSKNQITELTERGIRESLLAAVPYGIETDFFTPGMPPDERERIVAIGQDDGRDYATLAEAVRGTGIRIDLYCGERNLSSLPPLPPEIQWQGRVPRDAYRDILQTARAVVVPTRDLAYPTGQSVALEAMSCGAGVIATGTVALSEYLTHGETALLSRPGDAEGLHRNLRAACEADADWQTMVAAGQEVVRRLYSAEAMWTAVADVLHGAAATQRMR